MGKIETNRQMDYGYNVGLSDAIITMYDLIENETATMTDSDEIYELQSIALKIAKEIRKLRKEIC